ncbi:bis(5'-adenosyl)-triphosphatase [Dendrobium catenatum]|uniref:Bis(5'-adenosyl)-triphosphatase n=1 Tax=Dendrobium catenatum TaxID=906689 RepID=A0A2I0VG45_9ASPA|nr:bis(5'-adenosyl)-triphosphatase [Dendrobium catenatum]
MRHVTRYTAVHNRREVKRFVDLTADETTDLWLVAKEVGDYAEAAFHHRADLGVVRRATLAIRAGAVRSKNAVVALQGSNGVAFYLSVFDCRRRWKKVVSFDWEEEEEEERKCEDG